MKRTIVNELGRQVSVSARRTGSEVRLHVVGPASEAEWVVTPMEAAAIRDALAEALQGGEPR